ncbi:ABC transporter substrate-binding protein [Halosimplex aquaticum]
MPTGTRSSRGDGQSLAQFEERKPIGNGPFRFVRADAQRFELERFADHPLAHRVTFSGYELRDLNGSAQIQQALITDEVDVASGVFAPQPVVENFPDHVREVRTPAKWGYGVVFDHADEHFGTREVRQAVAHVIDREQVAEAAAPNTNTGVPIPCGITIGDQQRWLGDGRSAYPDYGVGASQTDAAADLLESAGYSRSDGTWEDESGEPISADFLSPSGWSDWTPASQAIVRRLDEFGFDVSIAVVPGNDLFDRYAEGDFTMGAFYWTPGGSGAAFPYNTARFQVELPVVDGGHGFPTGTGPFPRGPVPGRRPSTRASVWRY